jgi:hypothetical protein
MWEVRIVEQLDHGERLEIGIEGARLESWGLLRR